MANKAKGDGLTKRLAQDQVPLNAVRELVRAIERLGAEVRRVELHDQLVFLVVVRHDNVDGTGPQYRDPPEKPESTREVGATNGTTSTSLDEIVAAGCRRLKVTRKDLVTRSNRSRPVSVARLLIARHASVSRVASVKQVAAMLGRHARYNSLYVGIGRLKKTIPEFTMPLAQFLTGGSDPSPPLQALVGASWFSVRTSKNFTSDAEIGARLAVALPAEIT